jgi:hypothetical protein
MKGGELPPRAAHTVEEFEGAVIGMGIKGRCRNCDVGPHRADPIDNREEVALYVVEREPRRGEDDPRPTGYEIMSLWHRECAPSVGTRGETEYVLGGELRRENRDDGTGAEYLDDVELVEYSPEHEGVDLLAHHDEPTRGHDTREFNNSATGGGTWGDNREIDHRSDESKPSNPRVNASQSNEYAALADGPEEYRDPREKIVRAAELVEEVDAEVEANTDAARRALADLEEVAAAELRERKVAR